MFYLYEGEELNPEKLGYFISKHKSKLGKYNMLMDMYKGKHDIMKAPKKEVYKPDNRIVVNYAKYIVDTFNGYFIGVPIKVTHEEKTINEKIEFINKYNDQHDNNAELSKLCSIYGHAFELLYYDESKKERITYLAPTECFIVCDDTVEEVPLFAVRYYYINKVLQGTVYSRDSIINFRDGDKGIVFDEPIAHYFGGIPVIEYVENEERQSAFENVISIINAVNKTLSEKANEVDYFSDSYLVVKGAEIKDDQLFKIHDSRTINVRGVGGTSVDVDFLAKPTADVTQENLLNRLERLIFQIAMVANINDEDFGQASGISLQYKLQSMDNLAEMKQRKFESGMNRRYKMLFSLPTFPADSDSWVKIQYQFTRNVPQNIKEEAEIVKLLDGQVSNETKLNVLSIIENAKSELDKMKEDEESSSLLAKKIAVNERLTDDNLLEG